MTAQLPSKVRLAQIASFTKSMALPPSHDEIEAMACALLAAHEQEPVAWRYRFVHTPKSLEHGSYFTTDWVLTESEDDCNPSDCFERQPLYAHPAPSIPAAVPEDEDGQPAGFANWANRKLPAMVGAMTLSYCEDAWRAAMLQSGTLANEGTMKPIYEYYPDNGWSECNSKEHYEELTTMGHRTRIVYAAPKV